MAIEYLTTADLAKRYKTAESTIRYWKHMGKGPRGFRIGRHTLYDPAEVDRYDAEQKAQQGGGEDAA